METVLAIAFAICSADPSWADFSAKLERSFQTAQADNDTMDWQRFLNDRITRKWDFKKDDEIRQVLLLVAKYHEKRCKLPTSAWDAIKPHEKQIAAIDVKSRKLPDMIAMVKAAVDVKKGSCMSLEKAAKVAGLWVVYVYGGASL
jgi:hypothetical protein